jgi:hypothetical protein
MGQCNYDINAITAYSYAYIDVVIPMVQHVSIRIYLEGDSSITVDTASRRGIRLLLSRLFERCSDQLRAYDVPEKGEERSRKVSVASTRANPSRQDYRLRIRYLFDILNDQESRNDLVLMFGVVQVAQYGTSSETIAAAAVDKKRASLILTFNVEEMTRPLLPRLLRSSLIPVATWIVDDAF